MESGNHEALIAMGLARQTYLCGLFHELFGGATDERMVAHLFCEDTHDALKWLGGLVAADAAASTFCIGLSGRTLQECVEEALSCAESHRGKEDAGHVADILREDYSKLFQIPGEAFVRPWESPYTSTDGMLFRKSTLEVRAYYHEAGFKLQAEQHFPDDHIAAMMDYLMRMGQRTYDAYADGDDAAAALLLRKQADFYHEHVLTWVDAFADGVVQRDLRAYYAAFAGAMAAFAHVDCACIEGLVKELSAA